MSRWSIQPTLHKRPRWLEKYEVANGADGEPQLRTKHRQYAGMAVVASAALVSKEQVRTVIGRKAGEWQTDVWGLFDEVPEMRFGVSWMANACGRARLYVGKIDPDGSTEPTPINIAESVTAQKNAEKARNALKKLGELEDEGTEDTGPPQEQKTPQEQALNEALQAPLDELAGGQLGQSEMLKRLAVHLSVPGESYLIGFDDPASGERRWLVCSCDEVKAFGESIKIKSPDTPGEEITVEVDRATILRIWRPHPRLAQEADSPVRALRGALRELLDLSAHINATAESRLAGAGVLFVPEELAIPKPEQSEDANPLHSDPFTASLIEAMAAPLKNRDSASAVVPLVVRGPASAGKELKHISFSTEFDARVQEMREQAIRRIAVGMDLPAEILTGMGDTNHWCTLGHVRIMTRAGWKTYDQVSPGDEVLTLNHDTGLTEWQPLLAVNTWDVTGERMVRITGRRHSSVTTLNHRWPVLSGKPGHRGRTWTTTEELMTGAQNAGEDAQRQEYMVLGAAHADLPTEPKYTDALVELVAWYFTEGSPGTREGRRTPQVEIYQSHAVNPDNCSRIRRCLTTLFGPQAETLDKGGRYATPESVTRRAEARRLKAQGLTVRQVAAELGVSDTMVYKYLKEEAKVRDGVPRWRARLNGDKTTFILNAAAAEVVLEHAPARVVSLDFVQHLTAAQLELFVDTAVRGDGYTMGTTTPVLGQKDPAMCDAFELACILSGRSVNRYAHTSEGASADGKRMKTQHKVTASAANLTFAPRGRSFEEFTHTGTIWCPTTPNGTWLAEDDGHVFFTGNSAWALEESAIKLGIEPLLGLICDSLTTQFYQPALRAMGIEDWDKYAIWYETSDLALRPNRAPEASEAYAKGVISEATYRREVGFAEEDAPDDDERAYGIARQVALTNANLAPILLPRLNIPLSEEEQEKSNPQGTPAPSGAVENTTTGAPPAAGEAPATGTAGQAGRNEIPTRATAAVSSREEADTWLISCLDMAVRRALSRAGQFMIRDTPRSQRARLQRMEIDKVHTHLAADPDKIDAMLSGAYDDFLSSTPDQPCLHEAVDAYVRALIASGQEHRVEYLPRAIQQYGCV